MIANVILTVDPVTRDIDFRWSFMARRNQYLLIPIAIGVDPNYFDNNPPLEQYVVWPGDKYRPSLSRRGATPSADVLALLLDQLVP